MFSRAIPRGVSDIINLACLFIRSVVAPPWIVWWLLCRNVGAWRLVWGSSRDLCERRDLRGICKRPISRGGGGRTTRVTGSTCRSRCGGFGLYVGTPVTQKKRKDSAHKLAQEKTPFLRAAGDCFLRKKHHASVQKESRWAAGPASRGEQQ